MPVTKMRAAVAILQLCYRRTEGWAGVEKVRHVAFCELPSVSELDKRTGFPGLMLEGP